jgi:hypothetical protein
MSFFEPPPPPPPERERRWAPPLWDRPSEGTLPALVPVGEIVHRGDDMVAEIQHLCVYPNGFTINLLILGNPHRATAATGHLMMLGAGADWARRVPRIGVRFADGRTAGRRAAGFPGAFDVAKDEQGIPTEPIVRMAGGGGGSGGYHLGVWVYPLPPPGPLEVYVSLPAAGVEETKVVLDGGAVRAAADRARVIWG